MTKIKKTTVICASCNKPIEKEFLRAMGKVWHLEHFKCAKCRKTLSTQTFFERNGLPYCKKDFFYMFGNKCAKCNEYITKEAVNALGKLWHINCFTCSTCNKPIQPPYFFEKEGKPYCNDDYAKKFAPICKGCEEYIFEDYLRVLGGTWHSSCFLCKECNKPIQKKYFLVDKNPICSICINRGMNKRKRCYQSCCSLDHGHGNDENQNV